MLFIMFNILIALRKQFFSVSIDLPLADERVGHQIQINERVQVKVRKRHIQEGPFHYCLRRQSHRSTKTSDSFCVSHHPQTPTVFSWVGNEWSFKLSRTEGSDAVTHRTQHSSTAPRTSRFTTELREGPRAQWASQKSRQLRAGDCHLIIKRIDMVFDLWSQNIKPNKTTTKQCLCLKGCKLSHTQMKMT